MSGSDISDEDAILPAVGILDELDSDIDFSDEDDPALQDYSTAAPPVAIVSAQTNRNTDDRRSSSAVSSEEEKTAPNRLSNYAVSDSFWTNAQPHASERRVERDSTANGSANNSNSKERDAAIVRGNFIACSRFTIERDGFEYKDGKFGLGYYRNIEQTETADSISPWPSAFDGSVRVGIYQFAV